MLRDADEAWLCCCRGGQHDTSTMQGLDEKRVREIDIALAEFVRHDAVSNASSSGVHQHLHCYHTQTYIYLAGVHPV
jgi:hypothetical protein